MAPGFDILKVPTGLLRPVLRLRFREQPPQRAGEASCADGFAAPAERGIPFPKDRRDAK